MAEIGGATVIIHFHTDFVKARQGVHDDRVRLHQAKAVGVNHVNAAAGLVILHAVAEALFLDAGHVQDVEITDGLLQLIRRRHFAPCLAHPRQHVLGHGERDRLAALRERRKALLERAETSRQTAERIREDVARRSASVEQSAEKIRGMEERVAEMDRIIATHSAIMDRYDPQKKVALIVDEWGAWYAPLPGSNPGFLVQQNSVRDAVLAAQVIASDGRINEVQRAVSAMVAMTIATQAPVARDLRFLLASLGLLMVCLPDCCSWRGAAKRRAVASAPHRAPTAPS